MENCNIGDKVGIKVCMCCKYVRVQKKSGDLMVSIQPSCSKMFDIVLGDMPECVPARLGGDHLFCVDIVGPKRAEYGSYAMKEANRCGIEAKWFESNEP